jgi:hypothetical protein
LHLNIYKTNTLYNPIEIKATEFISNNLRNIKYFSYPLLIIIAVLIVSCEKDDSSIIDPILKYPVIDSAQIIPDSINSGSFNTTAFAYVRSEDPLGRVYVILKDPDNIELQTFELNDNGAAPDAIAGDGKFSGSISYSPGCTVVGDYNAVFVALTGAGLSSPEVSEQFRVVNLNNQPPVLSNLSIIPDSTQVNVLNGFIFQVSADDPDGTCDLNLQSVFYEGFRPSGIPLTRQYLYDDGSCCPREGAFSGDTTAGDKRYTRIFAGAPNELGYYRYFLKAVDRSGDTSNILSDSIYVYP